MRLMIVGWDISSPNADRLSVYRHIVLARISAFLPQMQQANQTLFENIDQDPQQYHIEAESDEEEYIEMVGWTSSSCAV